MGKGRFAFYAHLQPGSIRVKVGDTVKTGQVLGLLGNSGNSDAPHLHFHIMDGPRPLSSNGLPYRFTRFTSAGTLTNLAEISAGQKGGPLRRAEGLVRERAAARPAGDRLRLILIRA
jgi:murein DD-endopeptidase MepM/ murein hydrolase activator NlpD